MAEKMALVEAGDLSVRMEPRYRDEMGSLMRSFNSMVDNLEKAKQELQKCHYQQMERADRLASVGEMASGIAHEIKNPLAGISGAISVLADEYPEGDDRVGRSSARFWSRSPGSTRPLPTCSISAGPGTPEFSYRRHQRLVKKTLFFISQHPEARNIHRIKELTRDLPPVWVDEKQIQQVLFNVIINAIQAMPEGGTLTIVRPSLARAATANSVRVLVIGYRPGIPPGELERIFVPFHTTKTQGTGLGLPICRQLMEQHGGTIRVQSRVGEGTTFTIELPVVSRQNRKGKARTDGA